MELIINENTTIEEYEAWLSHPDTTIAMMREDSAKWSVLLDEFMANVEADQVRLDAAVREAEIARKQQQVNMELLLHVAKQEAIMEDLSIQAREILLAEARKAAQRPYNLSDDAFEFEVALIDKLEAKKLRNRIKKALVKVASLIGVGLMVIHNLL